MIKETIKIKSKNEYEANTELGFNLPLDSEKWAVRTLTNKHKAFFISMRDQDDSNICVNSLSIDEAQELADWINAAIKLLKEEEEEYKEYLNLKNKWEGGLDGCLLI